MRIQPASLARPGPRLRPAEDERARIALDVVDGALQRGGQRPQLADELALHVQLVDVRGRRVVATRTLEATEAAPSEDAYGGVIAANRALARVLAQVAAFCVGESGRMR